MILLTLGTTHPFDRLVKTVDEGLGSGQIRTEVFAQLGASDYVPKNMRYERMLEKESFEQCLKEASAIIGHAGMGTISLALDANKPLLVFPRLARYGECVNDHQLDAAKKYEELGHVLAAYTSDELYEKMKRLTSFVPKPRVSTPESVSKEVGRFLQRVFTNP